MKSLIDILNLSTDEIDELIRSAISISDNPEKYSDICRGKTLANLFFEPSTRTRMSIESAMYSLGGNVINMNDQSTSSASKGESLSDTIRVVSSYVDILAIRHPSEGAGLLASEFSTVPVINAGDGGHCHPTQTLADLLTIYREKGGFDGLTIGFCGDLKYGRTVHSLIKALLRYKDVKIYLISPKELVLPSYLKDYMNELGNSYIETISLEDAIPNLDVLYMTRIQKERFQDINTYENLKDVYILRKENLNLARDNLSIMHPLPRVNEISIEVDDDPRACYFKQVLNGKYIRMALIIKLLSLYGEKDEPKKTYFNQETALNQKTISNKEIAPHNEISSNKKMNSDFKCKNPHCITNHERGLKGVYEIKDGKKQCVYCEYEEDIS